MSVLYRRQKTLVRWALAGLLLLDVLLIGINWRMATAPRPDQSTLTLLKRQRELLAADVARGERIRKDLPAVEQQSNEFFKDQLPPAAKAYSAIVDNLGEVAQM